MSVGLYSLVAWPSGPLAAWVMAEQRARGFASFGAPHLNVRTPFEYAGDEGALIDGCAEVARGMSRFEARFRGWRRFPHTIFLELERSAPLDELHGRSLRLLPVEAGARDGEAYIPHLTLALGLCSWAEEDAWAGVQGLVPPVLTFPVERLALTLEQGGEIVELARYELAAPDGTPAPAGPPPPAGAL